MAPVAIDGGPIKIKKPTSSSNGDGSPANGMENEDICHFKKEFLVEFPLNSEYAEVALFISLTSPNPQDYNIYMYNHSGNKINQGYIISNPNAHRIDNSYNNLTLNNVYQSSNTYYNNHYSFHFTVRDFNNYLLWDCVEADIWVEDLDGNVVSYLNYEEE